MARFELKLPKMGESVAEATITSWLKEVGDSIELDEAVVEIATDKVDSEIPSEVEGKLVEVLFDKDTVVTVGDTIAIIETEGTIENNTSNSIEKSHISEVEKTIEIAKETILQPINKTSESGKFFSPLVRNIAQTEGVSMEELETIAGSGKEGRVTKSDILSYIGNRETTRTIETTETQIPTKNQLKQKGGLLRRAFDKKYFNV